MYNRLDTNLIIDTNRGKTMNWYKISQSVIGQGEEQTKENLGGPNVNVRPYEPIIQEAVAELRSEQPGLLNNITDINVDIGYGQFGSVSSHLPNTVNINMNNLKDQLAKELGRPFTPSDQDHQAKLKWMVKQTLVHEIAHTNDIGDDPHNPFPGGETPAERRQQEWVAANPM